MSTTGPLHSMKNMYHFLMPYTWFYSHQLWYDLWIWKKWNVNALYEEVSSPIEVTLINMKYKNEWVIKISYLIVCQMHQKERPQYVSLRIWYCGTCMFNMLEIRIFLSYLVHNEGNRGWNAIRFGTYTFHAPLSWWRSRERKCRNFWRCTLQVKIILVCETWHVVK